MRGVSDHRAPKFDIDRSACGGWRPCEAGWRWAGWPRGCWSGSCCCWPAPPPTSAASPASAPSSSPARPRCGSTCPSGGRGTASSAQQSRSGSTASAATSSLISTDGVRTATAFIHTLCAGAKCKLSPGERHSNVSLSYAKKMVHTKTFPHKTLKKDESKHESAESAP